MICCSLNAGADVERVNGDAVGLFLHVGYSLTERYLLEIHSPVRFRLDSVRSKLSALLNGDSAEQVRDSHLYYLSMLYHGYVQNKTFANHLLNVLLFHVLLFHFTCNHLQNAFKMFYAKTFAKVLQNMFANVLRIF